jgi:arylsulfatase A-like enzyme
MKSSTQPRVVKNIIVAAIWFGLVTGLVEGITLWVLQRLGWLSGPMGLMGASLETVWSSAVFDLMLFGLFGLVLSLFALLIPRLPFLLLSVFAFLFLAFFDWLGLLLIGRLDIYAILILAIGLTVELTRRFSRHEETALRFWRRSTPWLGAVALVALVGIQGGFWLEERISTAKLPQASPNSPNILVIVVDALRADHLSSYGYERPTSPNLDRVAEQGVMFENAFSASSWTKPSHASLVTGRYIYEHGTDGQWRSLDDRYPTIGEALQMRGYRTGAFSANVWVFNRRFGFGRGFSRFEDHYRSISSYAVNTFYGRVLEYYLFHQGLGFDAKVDRRWAPDINRALLGWIDKDPSRPFFAFLNYYETHDPYVPPQPYRSMFSQLEEPGGLISTDWDMNHIYISLTPEQLQGEIDAYDGAIAYVDEHIGRLLGDLQNRDLAENTLVVITSDHGDMFGEHGLFEHTNSLYREVIHVPLMIWWPEHVPAGERVSQPVTNAALPATLLDLIGAGEQASFPGPSLAQLWTEPNGHPDWPYPIAELGQQDWVPVQNPSAHGAMQSAISPQWHYITHEKFGEELYDWLIDPEESTDLAESPEFQSVATGFRTYLETLVAGIVTLVSK